MLNIKKPSIVNTKEKSGHEFRMGAGYQDNVSNDTLHNDLGISIISDVIKERSNKHHNRLETHTNPLMQPLLDEPNFRRLKRRLPTDLK
jgi:hypothetical protein